ncbi:MAG: tRNA dimethylallyltransferase [Candidatus Roizmanbacteria bacterium GW2011_GWC2_37_13]|uniref:tRNA dimethylallyltransferase n=1 Tax=Candidatus Roizmanbacteria bacterium GW2011_GWC2_37_13 TaxID=1618486 RepID=A0A0G0G6F9_9BACT|nr:MAG: tRNA delta(2)-isopentenylpyrophosphate transferase, tRNA dimethylallyltransferase [Candidatus Roizmanbacteria bacterium GW2011_GWC1_37_12]KKQ26678.1 MAG: tRNA dimethylallyltransferase [Candidatus Roizmanbacteria bacterium GW2011_GWC2_37_13]
MIIITGQTATGKTKLALEYTKKYNGELINFDSRQVYRYLDIITGKDKETIQQFKNLAVHLYDIVEPNQYFSSFEYVKIAQNIIKDIEKRGKTPILVGGSYFYLKHLLYGFDFKVPPNFKLREKLNKKTVSQLQKMLLGSVLKRTIPQMNHSDWNNPRRLIRKIEIENDKKTGPVSGSFPSVLASNNTPRLRAAGNPFPSTPVFLFIGFRYKNKDDLIKAIKARVEKRLKQGAIEEVRSLLKKGYKKTDPGLKTIGYKQIIDYLEKKITKEEAIEKWITAEIQYAKRQLTFMKKDPNIKWRKIK